MKNKIISFTFTLVLICIIPPTLNAQGFYLKFNAGYNFAYDDDDHEIFGMFNEDTYTATYTLTTFENIKFSFGKGINLNLSPGYMFNKNVSAELGISYLFGINTESNYHVINLTGAEYNGMNSCKGTLLSIIPSFTFAAGLKKIDPYSRFGFIIGVPSFTHQREYISSFGDAYRKVEKYNGGIALGFSCALGIKYPVSKKIGAFIELNMNSLNYSASKSVKKEYTLNGIDLLPLMTTSEKEIEYVNQYTIDSSIPQDPDKPATLLKFTVPFSSLAVNFGVCMKF